MLFGVPNYQHHVDTGCRGHRTRACTDQDLGTSIHGAVKQWIEISMWVRPIFLPPLPPPPQIQDTIDPNAEEGA